MKRTSVIIGALWVVGWLGCAESAAPPAGGPAAPEGAGVVQVGEQQPPDSVPPQQPVPDPLPPEFPAQPLGAELPLTLEAPALAPATRPLGPVGQDVPACGDTFTARKVADFGPDAKAISAISPEGRHVVAWAGQWLLADTATGQKHAIPSLPLAYSADERRVLFVVPDASGQGRAIDALDTDTGTWTRLAAMGADGASADPRVIGERAVVAITREGTLWKFDLETGETALVSQRVTSPILQIQGDRFTYLEETTAVLHDVRTAETHRFPDVRAVQLVADGRGLILVTTTGRVLGWSATGGTVSLDGGATGYLVNAHEGLAAVDARLAAGTSTLLAQLPPLLVRWNLADGAVQRVSDQANAGWFVSPDGERLAFGSARDDGSCVLSTARVSGGEPAPLTSVRGEYCHAFLNHDGSRAWVWGRNTTGLGDAFPRSLWAVDTGKQIPLQPAPPQDDGSIFNHFPRSGLATLYVDGRVNFHDPDTGALRYSTRENGDSLFGSYWIPSGPDGVLYPGLGAYRMTVAWDPRTGRESQLGSLTAPVCFTGARNLFRRGFEDREPLPPFEVMTWDPASERLVRYSDRGRRAKCTGDGKVAFLLEGTHPELHRLVLADLVRECRQPLSWVFGAPWGTWDATHVTRDGALIFARPDGVWRVDLPQLAPGDGG